MAPYLVEWLNLLFRWAHLIAGVGWIGTSFYFIALDLSLRKRTGQADNVMGSAWEVHGGGFYHVEKYTNAPDQMPNDLIWYKWEAYLTWVTGFALIVLQYYFHADSYLIDPAVMPLSSEHAILLSLASLLLGWIAYTKLCNIMLGRSDTLLTVFVFLLILSFSAFFATLYSGRGALIHTGALVGTMMAANVFRVIIPNQKKIAASLMAGERPDPQLGKISKQRSVHNNYLTLPVLLLMVSNHYPLLTGHPHLWLVVALIIILGASVRHLLNRHEAGDERNDYVWTLPVAVITLTTAMLVTAPAPVKTLGAPVPDSTALAITTQHCASCHAANPAAKAYRKPPQGIRLETLDDLRQHNQRIRAQAVQAQIMPLGNKSAMTKDERKQLGAWLAQQQATQKLEKQ